MRRATAWLEHRTPPVVATVLRLVVVLAFSLSLDSLFAVDAVAHQRRFPERRRLWVALVGALGVTDLAVFWGHPEDCVSVACVLRALVMQWWPALMAPVVVMVLSAAPPRRQWAKLAAGRQPAGPCTRPVECNGMSETVAVSAPHG